MAGDIMGENMSLIIDRAYGAPPLPAIELYARHQHSSNDFTTT